MLERAHDGEVDLRPVVWDATVVTPRDGRGVTIVLRVTYRTLEELCGVPSTPAVYCVAEGGAAARSNTAERWTTTYADAGTASRFLRSSSAS